MNVGTVYRPCPICGRAIAFRVMAKTITSLDGRTEFVLPIQVYCEWDHRCPPGPGLPLRAAA